MSSMVMCAEHPGLTFTLSLVRTEPTYNQPMQQWSFVSDFAVSSCVTREPTEVSEKLDQHNVLGAFVQLTSHKVACACCVCVHVWRVQVSPPQHEQHSFTATRERAMNTLPLCRFLFVLFALPIIDPSRFFFFPNQQINDLHLQSNC